MTATTPEARAHSRDLRRRAIARNPDRLCPPDHRHGLTGTCYSGHGCRCGDCRTARAAYKREEYYGIRRITKQDLKVSSLGVQRRLQALAYMGWSCQVIAERLDSHPRPLNRLRDGGRKHVMESTHERIDVLFQELCMIPAPGRSGRVTRTYARKNGYVSPLAWTDIDDPSEQPTGVGAVYGVDRERVEWLWCEGLSDVEIARRVGCSARTVLRIRQELGLEALWVA